ncbi:MAG: 50S ribosomal protein L31 [Pseudomonadales bacterium]|nr:50S ribosomal protein L31 [Pseudomonadales bacterium]
MKPEIHPQYQTVKATCSCGNVIEVGSTLGEDIHLDVCSNCHPFYTGKQKNIDSGGRVERFRQRFGNRGKAAASEE